MMWAKTKVSGLVLVTGVQLLVVRGIVLSKSIIDVLASSSSLKYNVPGNQSGSGVIVCFGSIA